MKEFPNPSSSLHINLGKWFRFEYLIRIENEEKYIVATPGTESSDYNPLTCMPPVGRTIKKEDWNTTPYLHLARLNTDNENEINNFVNKWGPLGVSGMFLKEEERFTKPVIEYEELVKDFIQNTKEYQEIFSLIIQGVEENNMDVLASATAKFNQHLKDCHPLLIPESVDGKGKSFKDWMEYWNAPTLLKKCYLLLWMNLKKNHSRCKHSKCQLPFIKDIPNQKYCSLPCKNAALRNRFYHKNDPKE